MRKSKTALELLNINVDLVNAAHEKDDNFQFGDTTFRQDGFSIGHDYLRLEGTTVTRGKLVPSSLKVDKLIGKGAFSKVHHGLWQKDNEEVVEVAVKQCCILESSSQRRDMLLKELRALCMIRCECLVQFQGAFLQQDTVTMVLEYMDRGSLEQLLHLQQNGLSSEGFVASVTFQMLWGLAYLHHEKILHRDIKPGNVLLHSSGCVKLCDFGMASMSDQSLHTTIVGTSRYMAPERLRARPYGRPSDVWSLGLVVLECLTGQRPWMNNNSIVELVVNVEEATLEDLISFEFCDDLKELLAGCLHQEPGKYLQILEIFMV